VKATNSLGEMAIHEAASFGSISIVRILLDAGNTTEERNPQRLNETPLRKAAATGRIGVVELLLQKGADRNINNHLSQEPSQIASGDALTLSTKRGKLQLLCPAGEVT